MQEYCLRVEYYQGESAAQAMARKQRPSDENGQTIWDRAAKRISSTEVNVRDYLDWCFKEAIPGLPFLNTLTTNVDRYVSMGSPVTSRAEVAFHITLMLERFQKLLEPQDNAVTVFPKDILFDSRYEFHPVFASEMGSRLGLDVPEQICNAAEKINKCVPYYLSEMQTLLKDWITIS